MIVFNLREPSNPDLRKNILDSIISPYDLVSKDAQELASDAVSSSFCLCVCVRVRVSGVCVVK